MNLKTFVSAVARYRKTFIAIVVVTFGLGVAWLVLSPTKYVSTTQLLVSISGSTTAAAYQNDDVVSGRVNSYIALLDSAVVSQRVIDNLGLSMSASQLVDEINATNVPPKTAVIDVSVTDRSAAQAQRLADTLATEFVSYVSALETPTGEDGQKVHVTVVSPASQPREPRAERVVLGVLIALLALLIGAIAVWIRWLTDPVLRTTDRAVAAAGVPALGSVTTAPAKTVGDLERYRRLRTRLRSLLDPDGKSATRGNVLVFASPDGEVDSGSIASNLGRSFEAAGIRSIVFRTDGAYVHDPVNSSDEPSIEAGDEGLPDSLSVSGWARDPELADRKAAELFNRLRTEYRYVLVAASPVREALTASLISDNADGVVLVVAADTSRRRHLGQAADSLRATGAPLIGVVLTAARASL